VVLPASICAIIPMFLMFVSSVFFVAIDSPEFRVLSFEF
jgi:hypothetical protein